MEEEQWYILTMMQEDKRYSVDDHASWEILSADPWGAFAESKPRLTSLDFPSTYLSVYLPTPLATIH